VDGLAFGVFGTSVVAGERVLLSIHCRAASSWCLLFASLVLLPNMSAFPCWGGWGSKTGPDYHDWKDGWRELLLG
jgi:hypothetical protein